MMGTKSTTTMARDRSGQRGEVKVMPKQKVIEEMPQAARILVWAGLLALYPAPSRADSWAPAPPLSSPRQGLAATTGINGWIYGLGGYDGNFHGFLSQVELYDPPKRSWFFLAAMPTERAHLAAAAGPDGTIYPPRGVNQAGYLHTAAAHDPGFCTPGPLPPPPPPPPAPRAATRPP